MIQVYTAVAGGFVGMLCACLVGGAVPYASHRNAPSSPAVQNNFVGHSVAEDEAWQAVARSFVNERGTLLADDIEVAQGHLGKVDGSDARSSALEEHCGQRR